MGVLGLIAAAGASTRMGEPKALLAWDEGTSFAAHLVDVFREAGLDPVVVTVPEPPHLASVEAALSSTGAVLLRNAEPALGLSGSVQTALARFPDVDGLVLTPVDAPFADVALVRELAGHAAEGALAAVPVVDGTWAHPVAFGRASFRALEKAAHARGPRTVLEALGDRLIEVACDDARLVADLNTPEDYRRLFAG